MDVLVPGLDDGFTCHEEHIYMNEDNCAQTIGGVL